MNKNVFSRVLSGSLASWSQIGINLLAQILVTPIYLNYWSTEDYGVWLLFITTTSFLQIFDTGHTIFLGNKFLIIGKNRKLEIEQILSSAIPLALFSSLIQIFLISIFIQYDLIKIILPETIAISKKSNLSVLLFCHTVVWLFTGSYSSLLTRFLTSFGYLSRFMWWQTGLQAVTIILPLIVVLNKGDFLKAGLVMLTSNLIFNMFINWDIRRIFKLHKIEFRKPLLKVGLNNYTKSLLLTIKSLLDQFRLQGVRLILSPLSGSTEMATFSTIRTGANVAMQGLGSITNPLLPELMRYLDNKDNAKVEMSFNTIWIIVVFILCPGVLISQLVIEPLYNLWTNNQLVFDSILFASLSFGVLIYAVSQPAISIVNGNNLLNVQLTVTLITALIILIGIFLFIPSIGVRAAGFSLLLGEFVSTFLYRFIAEKWLVENKMKWPVKSFNISLVSVYISGFSVILMAILPEQKIFTFATAFILLFWNSLRYWRHLPNLVKDKILGIFSKFIF